MKVVYMTRGTDPGIRYFKEPVVVRAMRIMAVGAILHDRRMFPHERSPSLCMAHVTGLIDACLFKLGGVRGAVRIVAVGAGHLSFPERHVRRALERGHPLKVTLTADLYLRPLVEKWISVTDLGQLEAVGGLLHDRVAVNTSQATSSMRACLPVGLNAFLMALETGFVLNLGGLTGIFAESPLQTHTLSSSFSHVIARRAVATLASLFLKIIAGIEEEYLPHLGFRELLELGGMAGLADLGPHIGGFLSSLSLC